MTAPTLSLVYDGRCILCNRWVHWVKIRDRSARIVPIPYQDRRKLEKLGLSFDAAKRQVYTVEADFEKRGGAAAINRVLEILGGPWALDRKEPPIWSEAELLMGGRMEKDILFAIRSYHDLGAKVAQRFNRHFFRQCRPACRGPRGNGLSFQGVPGFPGKGAVRSANAEGTIGTPRWNHAKGDRTGAADASDAAHNRKQRTDRQLID